MGVVLSKHEGQGDFATRDGISPQKQGNAQSCEPRDFQENYHSLSQTAQITNHTQHTTKPWHPYKIQTVAYRRASTTIPFCLCPFHLPTLSLKQQSTICTYDPTPPKWPPRTRHASSSSSTYPSMRQKRIYVFCLQHTAMAHEWKE